MEKLKINPFFRELVKNVKHYYLTPKSWKKTDVENIVEKLNSQGVVVVQNFLSPEECRQIREEMDHLYQIHSNSLWRDSLGADERFYGIEAKSRKIQEKFFFSKLINRVHDLYEKSSQKSMFTMGGRIRFKDKNIGSGGGWHRDRADFKQSKSILYLSDTDENNGAFQYLENSHHPFSIVKDFFKYGISLTDSRVTDEQVNQIIEKEPSRLKTFCAPAGTLLFVDTRGIHRGLPLKSGQRYALTNYIWYNMEIPGHIAELIVKD